MSLFKFALTAILLMSGLLTVLYQSQSQPNVVWGKQWGTIKEEWVDGIVLDGQGNVYISGETRGNLFGQNQGGKDIFVMKLDSNGQVLWSKQLGTAEEEEGAWLSIDALGNVYIGTVTGGAWFGENLGERDIVLLKLSPEGKLIWGKRIGTEKDDYLMKVAVYSQGHAYIVGWTSGSLFGQYQRGELEEFEGFFAKFDADGNLVWGKQFKDDLPKAITVDGQGSIYVGGTAYDDVNNTVATFLAKYSSDGNPVWRQVLPAITERESEEFNSLGIDRKTNVVYVSGEVAVFVDEDLLISIPDAFLAKYDGASGQRVWFKRFKSQREREISEAFKDVTVDGLGNVYVVGFAEGSLFGSHLGDADVIFAKFDAQGNMIWGKQWGTDKGDSGVAIAVDGDGSIYLAGQTLGNLFGTNAGKADIFVVKFRQ